ncbi:MAG: aminopeptidase P family protein [Bacteroidota bacterium]
MNFQKRINALRIFLSDLKADAFVTTFQPHLRYLVNYTGSNGVCVITKEKVFFATDFRYEVPAKKEVVADKIKIHSNNLFEALSKNFKKKNLSFIFDSKTLSVYNFKQIKKQFSPKNINHTFGLVEKISSVKEKEEIDSIKKAILISQNVFDDILKIIKPGITELDISAEISYRHKKYGASRDAFEPIVASGTNGAKPHAIATSKKIKNGEMITLDFGCFYNGYCSDLTRTIAIGKPNQKMLSIYNIVNEAQQLGIDSIENNISAKKIDKIVRDFISKKKFGKYFRHSLGHGIGLQVHELPTISFKSDEKLKVGNVFTIEPGIYLPNIGGVRIEDDVLMKENGIEVLTTTTKELIIL